MRVASCLLLLSACSWACANGPAEPVKLSISWNVALDADGHVTRLEPIANQRVDHVPKIRERLEQEVRAWRFMPGTVNGKPAATDTRLNLAISVVSNDADTASIRIDNANTGGWVEHTVPPHYPTDAIRKHISGTVVLRVDYDGTGKVVSANPVLDAPKVDSLLIVAAAKAVTQWTFRPELVGGNGVSGSVDTPFCFYFARTPGPPSTSACTYTPSGSKMAIGEGEMVALNPAATLATDVIGRTL